ncbi:MAG: hypothetical protein WD489_00435 [Rhodovibrionaceae bacterium]
MHSPHRLLLILWLLVAAPALAVSVQADDGFISNVPDLPLMPGLEEVPEQAIVFDKPEGRIVETFAIGLVTQDAVIAFYRETLPQLGWTATGPASYKREGEQLVLAFTPGHDSLIVRFMLSPL